MRLASRMAIWLLVGALGYFVVAPVVAALALGWMLTAGNVDWSEKNGPRPADPVIIGYRGDPQTAFGYAFENATYPTELGDAEAWVIPAQEHSELWAIFVHGIGGIRENGYRIVQVLHEAGIPVVMITYRNDEGAPAADDRLYSFGLTEWRDLEAAVDWTAARGARRVVIAAESMGAAITGQYLMRGSNTARVVGLALDAPALDFAAVVYGGGKRYWVPFSDLVATAALEISKWQRRDLREAVSLDAVAAFDGPLFVAHGQRDPLVPFAISERLAAARPDMIFVSNDADRHPRSFEADPTTYRAKLQAWIGLVSAPSGR
jgi:pimeloyl-ACP methyl ester carboxylesterase